VREKKMYGGDAGNLGNKMEGNFVSKKFSRFYVSTVDQVGKNCSRTCGSNHPQTLEDVVHRQVQDVQLEGKYV
jgi:hypothetical protein